MKAASPFRGGCGLFIWHEGGARNVRMLFVVCCLCISGNKNYKKKW